MSVGPLSETSSVSWTGFLVLSHVHSKQPSFGLAQEWLRELSFSRLECGVHIPVKSFEAKQ